jgi:hypothetical protein
MNNGGATEVGIWSFSARTGKLAATWDQHEICCADAWGDYPVIVWADRQGQLIIASGLTMDNWGEELFLRAPAGRLRRLPWRGIYTVPNTLPPNVPPVAW